MLEVLSLFRQQLGNTHRTAGREKEKQAGASDAYQKQTQTPQFSKRQPLKKTKNGARAAIISSCILRYQGNSACYPEVREKRLFHLFIKYEILIGFNLPAEEEEEERAEQTVGGSGAKLLHGRTLRSACGVL